MSDERKKREVAPGENVRPQGTQAKTERDKREAVERKPTPIEREWRGSGVCGDRHTD